jgi:hypothetical protein
MQQLFSVRVTVLRYGVVRGGITHSLHFLDLQLTKAR